LLIKDAVIMKMNIGAQTLMTAEAITILTMCSVVKMAHMLATYSRSVFPTINHAATPKNANMDLKDVVKIMPISGKEDILLILHVIAAKVCIQMFLLLKNVTLQSMK